MGVGLNLGQRNFSKGVLAPELFARTDVRAYQAGLKRGENVVILKRGGLTNRMGTRFVYELPGDGRLFPFEYSTEQTYALAFTQGRMTPMALGGVVLEEELEVTGITNANPAVVTVPYHGYSDGDEWFAYNIEGMTEINGRILTVTVIDDDNFSVGVDSTDWGVFTGSGGGTLRSSAPAPDPTPPTVPSPAPDPEEPSVGGGGGGFCVEDTTPILMADRTEKPASELKRGDWLYTWHEKKGWGDYRVLNVDYVVRPVYSLPGVPFRATKEHRIWRDDRWQSFGDLGAVSAGSARVAKITVANAHTYISAGVISHNVKAGDGL